MTSKTYVWYQWCLGLVLNCIDYYITKCYTIKVGVDGEANPIMHYVIEKFGSTGMLYVKLGFFALLAILLCILGKQYYLKVGKWLALVNIITGAVVGWGIYCLLSV